MKKFFILSLFVFVITGCGSNVDPNKAPKTDEPKGKPAFELSCNDGLNEYSVASTPLEFCYDPAWGEPVLEKMAGESGNKFHIKFSGSENGIHLYYESKDYKGSQDSKGFNYGSLVMTGKEESIKEKVILELGLSEDVQISVRKTDAGSKRAARVDYNNEITYYVPDAFADFNLMFKAPKAMAVEIDEFAFDMVIN
jgi:hypothetical protein